jgi:uncharacterized membrane protein (Fun14 family)
MSTYGNGGSKIGTVVVWFVVGVAAILGLKLALVLLGVFTRFALFALFTVGPVVLVGWLVLKALRYFSRDADAYSA